MRRGVLCAVLLLAVSFSAQAQALVKTGSAAVSEAKKVGVPTKLGAWQLVRYVSGQQAHFLYASGSRSFSLFVTETKNSRPLQAQQGWKAVRLFESLVAYLHKDSRNPEHTAIALKHQTQRRMVLGKLTETELVNLAKQLR